MTRVNKIWIRLFIVFFAQIIFKSFDQTFPNGPFELNTRSFSFTVLFVVCGLIIWALGDRFNRFVERLVKNTDQHFRRLIYIAFLHMLFGYSMMFLFNHIYRLGDLYVFGNRWENVHYFNPEFTIALLSIYLIVLGFDGYFNTQKELQAGMLKAEQLKKENILAQYRALKAQIEPHFLFNNLSVLSSLVYKDADLSSDFILQLSRSLRYIIEKNEFYLVALSEEIKFLESYFFLIKTRLDDGIFLENRITGANAGSGYLPPATLQMLVENAVAHNKYSPEEPLKIIVEKDNSFIVVSNNLNPRLSVEKSTKQGLRNIDQRYRLLVDKKIEIYKTEDIFSVKIPLLNQADYERFNI